MSISANLLPEFDREMENTRKTLERVPDDKFGWKPHPKSGSMGWLASHIATMTGWLEDTLTKESFDVSPAGSEPVRMPEAHSRKELLDLFDKGVKRGRAALEATSDEAFLKPWSLLAGGKPMFTMPRVAVVRSFVMNHIIHHRAQLGVYLRLNDVAVPSIYGPSADESGF